MSDEQGAPSTRSSEGSSRASARSVQVSLPLIAIVLGVVSLLVISSIVIGFRLGGETAAGQTDTSLAAQAAANDGPASLADEAAEGGAQHTDIPNGSTGTSPVPRPGDRPSASKDKKKGKRTIEAPDDRGMLHVKPKSVSIPAIDVKSSLVRLGLNPDNSLQVPEDYSKAGWFTKGSYPGDLGGAPALIVGHVDNKEGPAVFYKLDKLDIGDEIMVDRADGSTAVFVVYDGQQFPKDTFPTKEIYGDRKGSELVLITCTGEFNPDSGHYLDNYVVRAKLDPKASGLDA